MCGIAGMIGGEQHVTEERLMRMADTIAHRGPDDLGVQMIQSSRHAYCLGLAHRRLTIIDLSASGHQPMFDASSGNWIVFNGEIYNYQTLRKTLRACGAQFVTASDTEVILHAYHEWGRDCLQYLRGMFSFALWDAAREQLFCAVDRFGIKPFYFAEPCEGAFIFSSEIRAIRESGLVDMRVDYGSLDTFFAYGSVQAPRTIHANISALLAAHSIVFDTRSGRLSQSCYWQPPNTASPVLSISERLHDAVASHLVSDVPVGLFLSGGIDSSALAVLASRVTGVKELDAFTVTFREKEYGEGNIARLVGERFCKSYTEITASEDDIFTLLPSFFDAMDQPTIDGVNVYAISSLVRSAGIKTVLSGQGSDEVFGGYKTFTRVPQLFQFCRLMRLTPMRARNSIVRALYGGSEMRKKLAQAITLQPRVLMLTLLMRQLYDPLDRSSLLGTNELTDMIFGQPQEAISWWLSETRDMDIFQRLSYFELRGYLANTLLRDGDTMSMAHGLEVRVPYLDHVLVEEVFRLSMSQKRHGSLPKPALLRVVQNELPREVWARKKMGFTFPWDVWLRGPLRQNVESAIMFLESERPLGINGRHARVIWDNFLARRGVTWSRVWALVVLAEWSKRRL
jgi:asparagine synthase (glutamine-hydrolysing)